MRVWMAVLMAAACATLSCAQERRAPEFPKDAVWLDSAPDMQHSINDYRGKVLLIDFWEYTCINCIRDFAVVKRWYAKYHPYGFEVLGVHFGEFPMGFDEANVRKAAKRFRLPWPVVADVKGAIWNAYHTESWPTRDLIDPRGLWVMHLEGEGQNEQMEARIRSLLAEKHPEVEKIPADPPENEFAPQCGSTTQETYVGDWNGRGAVENAEGYHDGKTAEFHASAPPKDGGVALNGKWKTNTDAVVSADANATATLSYHARSVYAVLSRERGKVLLEITQDGKPLPQNEAGADVRVEGGASYVEVDEPRMYDLVKNGATGAHTLTLTPKQAGLGLHSFTFGNDCQQNFGSR